MAPDLPGFFVFVTGDTDSYFVPMSFIEILVLLFLVVDPFGNIPLVIMLLKDADDRTFQKILVRETGIAVMVLLFFFFAGGELLSYLNISQDALRVAGGVILFLISVKMIFRNSAEIFLDDKDSGPVVVPIAVPSCDLDHSNDFAHKRQCAYAASTERAAACCVAATSAVFIRSQIDNSSRPSWHQSLRKIDRTYP